MIVETEILGYFDISNATREYEYPSDLYKSMGDYKVTKVGGAHVRHVYFRSALSANCGVSEPSQPIGRKVPTPPGSSPLQRRTKIGVR